MKRNSVSGLIFFATLCAQANADQGDGRCLAGVFPDKFVASFKINDTSQKKWVQKKRDFQEEADYSWVVEPGNLRGGTFVPGRYAFGVAHKNDGLNAKDGETSISEIIKKIHNRGAVYLNTLDKVERTRADEALRKIPVYAIFNDGEIVLFSQSIQGLRVLYFDKPTHVRMTVKTPYAHQSYFCLVRINYQ